MAFHDTISQCVQTAKLFSRLLPETKMTGWKPTSRPRRQVRRCWAGCKPHVNSVRRKTKRGKNRKRTKRSKALLGEGLEETKRRHRDGVEANEKADVEEEYEKSEAEVEEAP